VHHKSYEHFRNEKPGELIVLCAECHFIFHVLKQLLWRLRKKTSPISTPMRFRNGTY
jgi:hypothetical protein